MKFRYRLKQLIIMQLSAIFYYTSTAAAQLTEKNFLDEFPVVLSVSRLEQPLLESASSVTVINKQTIAASGAREIKDLLRFVPGFQVSDYNGNIPVVSYHGLATKYSQQLQVLINGRSVYLPLFGGVFWSDLPISIEDIERIEVIRGPNAALYGSNSFSAVINITTQQDASTSHTKFALRSGENNINDAYFNYSDNDEDSEYSITGSFMLDDGFKNFKDNKRHARLSGNYNYQISDDKSITIETGYIDGVRGAGRNNGIGDTPREVNIKDYFSRLKLENTKSSSQDWYIQYYYHTHQFKDTFSLDAAIPGVLLSPPLFPLNALTPVTAILDYSATSERHDLELQHTQQLSDNIRYVAGGSLRYDILTSSLLGNDPTRKLEQTRLFANLEYQLKTDWIFSLGGMLEDNNIVETIFSPKLTLLYKINEKSNFRFTHSKAARLPVLLEEYSDFAITATSVLNPASTYTSQEFLSSGHLKAVTITTSEIAYSRLWTRNSHFNIKIFQEQIDDLISQFYQSAPITQAIDGRISDFANTDSATAKGAEAELEYQLSDSSWIKTGYSYINIVAEDIEAAYSESIPRHSLYMIGSQNLSDKSIISLSYNYYDSYRNIDSSLIEDIKRLDVKYQHRINAINDKSAISIIAQNLVDRYQSYNRGNEASTSLFIEFSTQY